MPHEGVFDQLREKRGQNSISDAESGSRDTYRAASNEGSFPSHPLNSQCEAFRDALERWIRQGAQMHPWTSRLAEEVWAWVAYS